MIETTIGDLLDGSLDGLDVGDHQLYVVRDGDVVFYVGQSKDPILRLWGHLSRGPWASSSSLGDLIKDNLPDACTWQVELWTPGECGKESVNRAEVSLIRSLHPCLNCHHALDPMPLPDRYQREYLIKARAAAELLHVPYRRRRIFPEGGENG